MTKDLTIRLDDDLYENIVERAGGPRKISRFLVPIIKSIIESTGQTQASIVELHQQLRELRSRVEVLEEAQRDSTSSGN